MKQRIYDFLAGLEPVTMRGKETGRRAFLMGTICLAVGEYEHVVISERKTITVTFKSNPCL